MQPKPKIMTAVDLSGYSTAAVAYSVWLAVKLNAELLMVNVINQRDLEMIQRPLMGYEGISIPAYLEMQVAEREMKMKGLLEAASTAAVPCSYVVGNGIPYQELLLIIEAQKPFMVVLGTKGRSNFTDVVVGSTARRLFSRCPVPLVIIPAGYDESLA